MCGKISIFTSFALINFKVLNLTRHVTQENDHQSAKEKFIGILNRSEMFYNKEEIPENESNKTAHKLCSTISGAKKYCPVRWNAMQNWFAHAREVRLFGCSSLKLTLDIHLNYIK